MALKKRGAKRRRAEGTEGAEGAEPAADAPAREGSAGDQALATRRKAGRQARAAAAAAGADGRGSGEATSGDSLQAAEEAKAKQDRRGVIHFASLPPFMKADKVRHEMEQFGEVGRVYLAPEDNAEKLRRKRAGGNRKQRFTEGWVEFSERKIARRVAMTLHGSTIGGKKRHNFYRDDMWNMKYLPGFKWHMLKEGTIYNRQVRKARLQQKLSQARRETDYFLEGVDRAKTRRRIEEKRASKGQPTPRGAELPERGRDEGFRKAPGGGGDMLGGISDRVLASLF